MKIVESSLMSVYAPVMSTESSVSVTMTRHLALSVSVIPAYAGIQRLCHSRVSFSGIQILFLVLFMVEKYQKLPRWTKARSLRSSLYCPHLTQTVCSPLSPRFVLLSFFLESPVYYFHLSSHFLFQWYLPLVFYSPSSLSSEVSSL